MNLLVKSKLIKQPIFYFLLPLLGGIFMGLTTAPVGAWPLAWLGQIPLWLAIRKNPSLIPWLPACLWGIGYHGIALFWITGIHPMTWMGVPWLASLFIAGFCWVFITFWGCLFVTIWSICQAFLLRKYPQISPGLWVLTGTALWCFNEWLWSQGPLWWTSLSYTQSPHNLLILQLGKWAGPTAITAAIVGFNGLIAQGIYQAIYLTKKPINWTLINIATAGLLSLHIIGFILYNQPLETLPNQAFKVGIIQGNIPNTEKLYANGIQQALERYQQGYEWLAAAEVDAILTPEGALPFDFRYLKEMDIWKTILDHPIVVWLGIFGGQDRRYTNSIFTITEKGEVYSRYDKVKLVPLGEYIPFEEVLGKIINRLSPLEAQLAAGDKNQIFDTPLGRAIIGICYESAFAEHFRRQAALGGEFILTASNNAHYAQSMPAQHHAQDVMRAIETNRWAVRATNTGYSGIVDPHGRTIWISGFNRFEVHSQTIYRQNLPTLYVRWGDWLIWLLLSLSGILLVVLNEKSVN